MRTGLSFLVLCALCLPLSASGNAEVDRITEFLLAYTGDSSREFRGRVETTFGRGFYAKQNLENLVAVLLLYEKVIGTEYPQQIPERVVLHISHFGTVNYANQVARLALLDYLLGTEETQKKVRILAEGMRSNGTLSFALSRGRRAQSFNRNNIQRLIKSIAIAATADANLDVDTTFAALLERHGLAAPDQLPVHRSRLVTVSAAEVQDKIAAVAIGALRPPAPGFPALPESDLRRLLLDESTPVRVSALTALCDRTVAEVDSIAALLAVARAEWVDAPLQERVDRALEIALPLAVRARLQGTGSLEVARCVLEILQQK